MVVTILALALIAAGLTVGLFANRRLRRSNGGELSISDLVGQALTLAVLFLAFVLVGNSQSDQRAQQAAVDEAGVVDRVFELAEYVPPEQRQQIQGTMVCYARAIVHHEWPRMGEGRSTIASTWSTQVRANFSAVKEADSTVFSMLDTADGERSAARQNRITEEATSTPPLVYALMIVTVAVSLAAFAFSVPFRRMPIACLIGLALMVAATLTVVNDLERPFSGLIRIEPVALQDTAADITEDYMAAYDPNTLPCDATGRALPGH